MLQQNDEKEADDLKKICNHYLVKRKETLKNTDFKVEVIFGDVISKVSFSQEQITKMNKFLSKNNENTNIKITFNFFKPEKKEKNNDYQPSAPPVYKFQ